MDWFTILVIISIIVGMTAPFVHLYIAYVYVPRKFAASLFNPQTAKQAVALLRNVMQYKETEEGLTVFQEFCGMLGQYLGRYIGTMFGRANRDIGNAAIDALGESNPAVGAFLSQPGVKKMMKNPIVATFLKPILEGAVNGALSGIPRPPQGGAPQ